MVIPLYHYGATVTLAKPYLMRTAAFAGGENVCKWRLQVPPLARSGRDGRPHLEKVKISRDVRT